MDGKKARLARKRIFFWDELSPLRPAIDKYCETSLRAIAVELNARGMLTRRGGRWHVSTAMNLLDRLVVKQRANRG